MPIRPVSARSAVMLAAAALVPLVAFAAVSLVALRRSSHASAVAGILEVAVREADKIQHEFAGHAALLNALAADLQDPDLELWQQDRILKDYARRFHVFRELTIFDASGVAVASSRVGQPRGSLAYPTEPELDGIVMSPVRVDDDMLPARRLSLPIRRLHQPADWLVAEQSLEDVGRLVDQVRIGARGYAMLATDDGRLIAHGDPDRHLLVAQGHRVAGHPLLGAGGSSLWRQYVDERGEEQLGAAARVPGLGLTLIVEQPTAEAFATAAGLERQFALAAFATFGLMVMAGVSLSRRFIVPLDRLEREVMFGRVVAGLFHDLNHPIQNIGNSARLLLGDNLDADTRASVRRTLEREFAALRRFMDDVKAVARPRPIERTPVDVNTSVAHAIEAVSAEGHRARVSITGRYASGSPSIDADHFALSRVYGNLLSNAVQATPPGGSVVVTTVRVDDMVEVHVSDTGTGIAPERLAVIFNDFVTTKRGGMGLGLATSRRVVEQLGGSIAVVSGLGRGATFTLRFRASTVRALTAAS